MKARAFHRGFAAVAAIFLIVVLAVLAGFMVMFSNAQQLTAAQDVAGSRAYWAARAGLEWGITYVNANSACPASPPSLNVDGYTVAVQCALTTYSDGSSVNIYQLRSTATSGTLGGVGYSDRSLSASLEL